MGISIGSTKANEYNGISSNKVMRCEQSHLITLFVEDMVSYSFYISLIRYNPFSC